MDHRVILFTDIGDTIIDEGTEVRNEPNGVVLRAECVPGAREVMLSLHEQGYVIAMVADGLAESFRNTMTQHGLDQIFAARAISEVVGVEKPDPRIFQSAMDQLRLKESPHNVNGTLTAEFQSPAACKSLDYPPGNLRDLQFAFD